MTELEGLVLMVLGGIAIYLLRGKNATDEDETGER